MLPPPAPNPRPRALVPLHPNNTVHTLAHRTFVRYMYGMAALIDETLSERLRRFDPHCEISLIRTCPKSHSPWLEQAIRVWVVTIRPTGPGNPIFKMAQAIHPRLTEAIRLACDEAEQHGWAR